MNGTEQDLAEQQYAALSDINAGADGRTLVVLMTAHLNDQTDIIAPATAKTLSGLFRERVARSPD